MKIEESNFTRFCLSEMLHIKGRDDADAVVEFSVHLQNYKFIPVDVVWFFPIRCFF